MNTAKTVASLVTRVRAESATHRDAAIHNLIQMMMSGSQSPGFWSAEIIAPTKPDDPEWILVQRYATTEETRQWESSKERQQHIKQLESSGAQAASQVSTELVENGSPGSVASAIVTVVKPGMEAAYSEWEARIQYAQAMYPGYRGAYLQPPSGGNQQWTTMLRFDSPESMEGWFASPERGRLVPELEQITKSTDIKQLGSSFPGWAPADQATGEQPANWKVAMLVLLGLFPIVMFEIKYFSPRLSSLNPAVGNLISLIISVALVTWGTMPLFVKAFGWWLLPKPEEYAQKTAIGTLVVVGLFLLEIFLLHNLL